MAQRNHPHCQEIPEGGLSYGAANSLQLHDILAFRPTAEGCREPELLVGNGKAIGHFDHAFT